LRFGQGCVGELSFGDEEGIQGAFYDMFDETVMFAGNRRKGPLWCGKAAWKFAKEWREFVSEAYGR
jgi:hypothetical protein